MAILENDHLKVTIRTKGAELTSIYNKKTKIEHLWQAIPDVWPWHGPNLFPVIGACINNQIHVGGKPYSMERHGFARKSEFTLTNHTATQALFSLTHTDDTLAVYPYKFELQIEYTLQNNGVKLSYRVVNKDAQTIYFSIGGHPAFNVPFLPGEDYSAYYVEFEQKENLERHLLTKDGLFNGKTEPVQVDGNKLHLHKDLFNQDALVFKNILSRKVTIGSSNHAHRLSVEYTPFNYLGIWAKPQAPFVCIEPWLGCADTEGKAVDISEKEAIQHVTPGNTFEASFTICIS